MKRALCMLLMSIFLLSATAFAYVDAIPNQKLSFRTGPNTKYAELFTLPQSTDIIAIEYEEGNDVTWVQCEFIYRGNTYRAYTGLKRMDVLGTIYYPDHSYIPCTIFENCNVVSAPYAYSTAAYGSVTESEVVNLLRYDGDYAYIEFYDSKSGRPSRGWVPSILVEPWYAYAPCSVTAESKVYSGPDSSYRTVGRVGAKEFVMAGDSHGNYTQIQFYSSASKSLASGYVPTSSLEWLYDRIY